LNKKIRNAEKQKIPYILIVGEQEQTDTSVSVREYRSKEQYVLPLDEFVGKIVKEYKVRAL
jgi:threonyl-tRNA synthetase